VTNIFKTALILPCVLFQCSRYELGGVAFTMAEIFGLLIRLGIYLWVLMLVYNFLSAVFGFNQLRRFYITILRTMYSVRSKSYHKK